MTKKSRRKVLKGLAISLPTVSATPAVESVITPAHAHTSNCSEFEDFNRSIPRHERID